MPDCWVPARLAPAADQDHGQIWAIRDALTSVDDLLGELDGVDAPDLTELGRAVIYAWGTFWAGRYATLAAMLPRLLADAQAATHTATAADAGRATDLAVQVHQITAGTLLRFGEADLGHVAARESLRLAAGASDPLRMASARYIMGHVLIAQGRYLDAERVSVATAEQVAPTARATTAQRSMYGGVLLRGVTAGATAAARQRRTGAATDLLAEAATAARQTGADRTDYDVIFGPSNLVMQSTDYSIVADDYVAVAEAARRMPRDSMCDPVHRRQP